VTSPRQRQVVTQAYCYRIAKPTRKTIGTFVVAVGSESAESRRCQMTSTLRANKFGLRERETVPVFLPPAIPIRMCEPRCNPDHATLVYSDRAGKLGSMPRKPITASTLRRASTKRPRYHSAPNLSLNSASMVP